MRTASEVRAGLRVAAFLAAAGAVAGGAAAQGLTALYGAPPAGEAMAYAGVTFVLVLGALVLGGRRGLVLLWGLLLVAWTASFGGPLLQGPGAIRHAFHVLPDTFTAWNVLALPPAAATALLLHRTRDVRPRALLGVLGVWIALAAASAAVSGYAPDVGGGPRDDPFVAWSLRLLLPAAPLLLGGWMMLRLRRRAP